MKRIVNRKASFKYQLFDRLEAGIVLTGSEVKSIKSGRMSLGDAFVRIKDGELFLINAQVPLYQASRIGGYNPSRQRKLLVHKREILGWQKKAEAKNYTIVPTVVYSHKNQIKIEIALAKGKRQYEKKESIKRKDLQREAERVLKNFK